MNIEIQVTGSTHKTIRANLIINGNLTGNLQVERVDFTKFCNLLFGAGYSIKNKDLLNPIID